MDSDIPEPVSESVVRSISQAHFSLDFASLKSLPGEYDSNWRGTCHSGERFVVKIMHSSRDSSLLDLQVGLLQRLAERAPTLSVPRLVRSSTTGEYFVLLPVGEVGPRPRFLWILRYIEGTPYALTKPHAPPLVASVGAALGEMTVALAGFSHPAAFKAAFKWDLSKALWISAHVHEIESPERRALVDSAILNFRRLVEPAASAGALRRAVIHGDANDYNVLTRAGRGQSPTLAGLLDFGDAHESWVVADVAIGAAYAVMGQRSPLDALCTLTKGFAAACPLSGEEVDVIFPLTAMRLAVSVVNSTLRKRLAPDDEYIVISERPAWAALEALACVTPAFAAAALRSTLGLTPLALTAAARVHAAIASSPAASAALASSAPIRHTFGEGALGEADAGDEFDWTAVDRLEISPAIHTEAYLCALSNSATIISHFGALRRARAPASGASLEGSVGVEPTNLLLGSALVLPQTATFSTPRSGRVVAVSGSAVMFEHSPFARTIWRGLDLKADVSVGAEFAGGVHFGTSRAGRAVFVQALADDAGYGLSFPVWGRARDADAWASFVCDPVLLAGLPAPPAGVTAPPSAKETLADRRARFGGNVRLSYAQPIKAVRGAAQFLFDANGAVYLDTYNNVPSVGHAHPRVVRAVAAQTARLATNTRYLHDGILAYSRELTALLPDPLRVCFFTTSGSEANELALRLARTVTRRKDVIVLRHAYHGHTGGLIDISPYKFDGPGGSGAPPTTHVVECPDVFRGPWRRSDPLAGEKYAADGPCALLRAGVEPAAFIAESVPSVAGQIELPDGYLRDVYAAVRAAGGVCIADEVQTGFGRLGSPFFWGFQLGGVVPDIVTVGKPIGNGFPLGAVVTTRAIADAFDNGMEYFCTGGGGPVAAAAGLAVLAVLRDEELPANAARVGEHLKARLQELAARHPLIGDVRGRGLFLGVELVRDAATLEPGTEEAAYVCNRLRDVGILVGTEGPAHNILKVRPPLCFTMRDADYFVKQLDAVLAEDGVRA